MSETTGAAGALVIGAALAAGAITLTLVAPGDAFA
jgi:hypothetical protein